MKEEIKKLEKGRTRKSIEKKDRIEGKKKF